MARRYHPSSGYDSSRYRGGGYMSRQSEPVSYRDRWLGGRTESDSYRHRSSSPERYRQTMMSGSGSSAAQSGYRSRSWETSSGSTNPRYDRMREGYSGSGGGRYGSAGERRSYGRSISFGKDSYLSPVTAPQRKSDSYTGGILKHTTSNTNDPPVSILSRGGANDNGSGPRRQRHNTLTFGVSGEDLDRARNNIQKYTRRLSDDTRPSDQPHHPSSLQKKTTSRYSLPDVFDSFSGSAGSGYYDNRLDSLMQSRGYLASSSLSSSYSGYSGGTTRPLTSLDHSQHRPLTAGTLEHGQHGAHGGQSSVLASASNGSMSGAHLPPSARHTPTLMSSSLPSGIDLTSSMAGYSSTSSALGPSYSASTEKLAVAGAMSGAGGDSAAASANDETLKSLQKHYMAAITSLNPQLPAAGDNSDKAAEVEDPEAKKPTELIDDILKLWEESQAENRRLRLENNALKLELQTTKNQLELAVQASTQNSESDNQKEEKLVMEKKIAELEDKLMQFNVSTLSSDQTITQLKDETMRLKEENAGLIKAISKLSN